MSRNIVAAVVSGLMLAAPYLFPVLFPLAWIAFVPLFWALERAKGWRRAIFCGWLTGFFAHLAGFYWLVYTISVFGGFPYPASVFIFLIYAALQGLQMAGFAALVRLFGFGPLQLLPAVSWVTPEFLFPLLFPWYLANSQVSFSWYIQTADLVGPYGASFLLMWFNTALYRAVSAPRERFLSRWASVAYAAMFAVASVVYGIQRLEAVSEDMNQSPKLSVAAVQANVDIDLKWNPDLVKQNLEKHIRLTDELGAVPLVIWPESSVEEWVPEGIYVLPTEFVPTFKSARARFIFGARSFRGKPGESGFKAFNTAFLADGEGRILARYHKQVLLAFGEYLPFAGILSRLPAMPFADGFTPGDGPRAFHLWQQIRVAPLICYEDLMPDLARRFVREAKANVLVNLTNDAWYGRSVGPWQHARLSQWRAIETRRSLLRVTNTGVTSYINAKGEIVQSLPIFSDAVMQSELDVLEGETYYVRFGDWFAWLMAIISAGLILWRFKRALVRSPTI